VAVLREPALEAGSLRSRGPMGKLLGKWPRCHAVGSVRLSPLCERLPPRDARPDFARLRFFAGRPARAGPESGCWGATRARTRWPLARVRPRQSSTRSRGTACVPRPRPARAQR